MKFNLFRKNTKKKKPDIHVEPIKENEYLFVDPGVVGYPDEESQREMYKYICRYINPGESVIDFGAGRGDLYAYLLEQDIQTKYVGVEVSDILVSVSKQKYPDIDMRLGNYLEYKFLPKYDWGVNIFTLSKEDIFSKHLYSDDMDRLRVTIDSHLQHVEYGVCIGLLGIDEEDYISYNPIDVIDMCEKQGYLYILDKAFTNEIFNLVIFKQI